MYVIAQEDPFEVMPDFLVGEDKNIIKFQTSTAAYDFLKKIDIERIDLINSSIVLLRMH
jgi:hypothetical protein|tara:strand:- start:1432 stop:1608 length:177 start_codon:yes stop_codon:yes gene_type:complete